MKRLLQFEQQIGKFGERLVANSSSSNHQNQWVVNEIRTMLDKKMATHSSQPEVTQHFSELFGGLEKIIRADADTAQDPLALSNTQAQIIEAFDKMYYKGQATFAFTIKVLKDRRITDVNHFTRAVVRGGTILRSWKTCQRETFHLHIANKLWILGRRDEARAKLLADYQQSWRHRLKEASLSNSTLELLLRALVVTSSVNSNDIMKDIANDWQSLYIIWRLMYPNGLRTKADDASLLQSLNHVSNLHTNLGSATNIPECLNFVPSSPKHAPRQIRSALLRFAQDTKDKDLLDLLLISSSESEDKVVEAGIIATMLAIA